MKKLVHVKSLITLALCLMMCFTFFAPASTVQAKKRVVDNVFMYPTDPYSYPTCTGWVPCKKTFQVLKRHRKLMSEKLHGKSLIQHICIKLLHQEVKCSIQNIK